MIGLWNTCPTCYYLLTLNGSLHAESHLVYLIWRMMNVMNVILSHKWNHNFLLASQKALQYVPWLQNHSFRGSHSSCDKDSYVAQIREPCGGKTVVSDWEIALILVCEMPWESLSPQGRPISLEPLFISWLAGLHWLRGAQLSYFKIYPFLDLFLNHPKQLPRKHITWDLEQERENRVVIKIPFDITVFPRNISLSHVSHGGRLSPSKSV